LSPRSPKKASTFAKAAPISYQELLTLSEHEQIPPALNTRLTALLTTPFVNNEASYRDARPHRPVFDGIGGGVRLVQWNIERGLQLDNIKLAFTDSEAFVAKVKSSPLKAPDGETRAKVSTEEIEKIRAEMKLLQAADVLVLNEVDWGMKRTDYRCVVCELGTALNMNWAWASNSWKWTRRSSARKDLKRFGTRKRERRWWPRLPRTSQNFTHCTEMLCCHVIQSAKPN